MRLEKINIGRMDIFLLVLAGVFLVIGVIGDVLPGLPGVPFSYLGLIMAALTSYHPYSWTFMFIWLGITALITLLDYLIPSWGTKHFGGSDWGANGALVGVVLGFFAGPWGIIAGPFIGAVVGELLRPIIKGIPRVDFNQALRAGLGSFIGIISGTILKLICSGMMIYYYIDILIKL